MVQRQLLGHETFITDIVFSTQSDGTVLLISASDDGHVIFRDYATDAILNEMTISAGFVVLSPSEDGETLLVASNGRGEIAGTAQRQFQPPRQLPDDHRTAGREFHRRIGQPPANAGNVDIGSRCCRPLRCRF